MEYNRIRGFGSEGKKEKTAQNSYGALPDQDPDDGMDLDCDMLDKCFSTSSTLTGALSRYGSNGRIPDGLESAPGEGERKYEEIYETPDKPDSNAQVEVKLGVSEDSRLEFPPLSFTPGSFSPLWERWRSSLDDDMGIEGLGSSNNGAMVDIPDSVGSEMDTSISTEPEAPEDRKATITDGVYGVNLPYPNDKCLDSTSSTFNQEKPLVVSSTEIEIQLSLADRQPHHLVGENSAAPGGKEQFPLCKDTFSFRFPKSLPEAPANIGFSFSPRFDAIPHEEIAGYDQDKCGNFRPRPVKTAKRHYPSGTASPDQVPLGVPVKMSGTTGESPPTGLWSIERLRLSSGSLAIRSMYTGCLLCTSSEISPRYNLSLEGNDAEGCDQKLSENICTNLGRAQEGNREGGHRGHMTKNTEIQFGGQGIAGARGGLHGKSGVEDYLHSA